MGLWLWTRHLTQQVVLAPSWGLKQLILTRQSLPQPAPKRKHLTQERERGAGFRGLERGTFRVEVRALYPQATPAAHSAILISNYADPVFGICARLGAVNTHIPCAPRFRICALWKHVSKPHKCENKARKGFGRNKRCGTRNDDITYSPDVFTVEFSRRLRLYIATGTLPGGWLRGHTGKRQGPRSRLMRWWQTCPMIYFIQAKGTPAPCKTRTYVGLPVIEAVMCDDWPVPIWREGHFSFKWPAGFFSHCLL